MRVREAAIMGVIVGLILGSTSSFELHEILLFVTVITIVSIFMGKQMLKGPLWGFLGGFAAGYSFASYIFT